MRLRTVLALSVLLPIATWAAAARAAPKTVVAPAGGGLDALEVTIDAAAGAIRTRRCKVADCSDGAGPVKSIPIGIETSRIDIASATLEVISVGEGRRVVRARVPDLQRKDLAFEALLGAHAEEPIFAALTGYTNGSDGDRSGAVVSIYDRDASSKFVIVAETREDTRICGQTTTPLAPRGLDPRSMQLRGATLHRIDKKAREAAERVIADAVPAATLAAPGTHTQLGRVLLATGGSAPGTAALTDGDAETAWKEQRPGDGHGEFATMRTPAELPIHALVLSIAPKVPAPAGAAPRTFFVATDDRLFAVAMPEDAWRKPGQRYRVPLPGPVKTTCLAIVLDEAYADGLAAPEVTIAEVSAVTKFDVEGASLDDVARALGTGRAEEAAALLRRSGDKGLLAVVPRYASLDANGRALAVDVAASTGACQGPAMDVLTRAISDREPEVRKRALGRIERCGKAASEALAAAVADEDEVRRAAVAPLLATVAPNAAIDPLAAQMGKGAAETRKAVRGAFARAAAAVTRDKLLPLVAPHEAPLAARLDLLRALGPRLVDLRPESDAAIAALLRASPDMPTRYLLAQPLAHLARAPEATPGALARLADLARRDPDAHVRARAVELSAGVAALGPVVVLAVADAEPRVREAALRAVALAGPNRESARASAQALHADAWPFVRAAAADALGAADRDPASTAALAEALEDPSAKVRSAALVALGKQRAIRVADKVRARLDDTKEEVDVRALAARALGAMCARSSTDRLTTLAVRALHPVDGADDRLGMAAIEALGALHPADLEKRLAPLRAKDARLPIRRAVERILAEPTQCP